MSTNYYWRTAKQVAADEEGTHIGKSGVVFMNLRGYLGSEAERPILSWQDWQRFMAENDGQVYTEYGTPMSTDEFVAFVNRFSHSERQNQLDWLREHRPGFRERIGPGEDWADSEGFSFYGAEFC